MSGELRSEAKARRWEIAGALLGGALTVAFVALAAAAAVPPSLANLASEVSDGITPVAIAERAEVVVPADWIVIRDGADALSVRTPDGALHARLDVVTADADAAAAALVAGDEHAGGPARSETLASGMTVVHVDTPDGMLAAVSNHLGAESVRVRVTMADGEAESLAAYRPAVGDLLEGIRA